MIHEATYNLRQVATIGGTLVSADGRSPLTTVLLAMDAKLVLSPGDEIVDLGDLIHLRSEWLKGRLIIIIRIPKGVNLCYEYVARSPADLPIVSTSVAIWSSGRTRVILGGFGESPLLSSDGPERGGEELAAKDAFSQAGDEWATAEYRMEIAPILVKRCLTKIES